MARSLNLAHADDPRNFSGAHDALKCIARLSNPETIRRHLLKFDAESGGRPLGITKLHKLLESVRLSELAGQVVAAIHLAQEMPPDKAGIANAALQELCEALNVVDEIPCRPRSTIGDASMPVDEHRDLAENTLAAVQAIGWPTAGKWAFDSTVNVQFAQHVIGAAAHLQRLCD